jgi:hypothetical protein
MVTCKKKKRYTLPTTDDVREYLHQLKSHDIINVFHSVAEAIEEWPEDEMCDFHYYDASGQPGPGATFAMVSKIDKEFGLPVNSCLRVSVDFIEEEVFSEDNLLLFKEREEVKYAKHMGIGRSIYYPHIIDHFDNGKSFVVDAFLERMVNYV